MSSERDKIEVRIIPLDVLTAVYSVDITPERTEGPAWENLQKTIAELAKGAEVVRDGSKKIGATIGEIAATIKAA